MSRRAAWSAGFISFALLGFELSLMRLLSYAQWYHFAYMIISVALLGFGASGTIISLFRSGLVRRAPLIQWTSSLLCALTIGVSPLLLSSIALDPFLLLWDCSRLWQLIWFYLAVFLPFFFGALFVGLCFVRDPEQAGRIYFFNLVGSGLGSAGALFLMHVVEPAVIPLAMAFVGLIAVWISGHEVPVKNPVAAAVPMVAAVCLAVMPRSEIPMSQYKSLAKTMLLPDARVVSKRVSPLGVVEVVESDALRYAPGLSLMYRGTVPIQRGLFNDGEWIGPVFDERDTTAFGVLWHSTSSLPYRLKSGPRVLVIGSGTGSELLLARLAGAVSVRGIEMNRALIEAVREYRSGEGAGEVEGAAPEILIAEARSFLSRIEDRYDVIIVPILEGFTASAAGTHALFENYLFTVESFRTMVKHLAPGGLLVINTWMTFPPRAPVKAMAMIVEALREEGVEHPEERVAAIRSWGTFAAVAKNGPLSEGEVGSVRKLCEELAFDLVYVPGVQSEDVNKFNRLEEPVLYDAAQAILRGDDSFFDDYLFHVRPARDNQPYFSHYFKWKSLPELQRSYTTGQIPFFELGYFLLLITLGQLVIVSFVFIVLPLQVLRRARLPRGSIGRTVLYFGGIGLGYMFIEIVMIQKFILFLGHPIYSVTTIITTMLVASGVGSFVSGRFASAAGKQMRLVFVAIVLLLFFYSLFLPSLLSVLMHLAFGGRLLVAILLLVPLGFLMGFPFPLGVRRLSAEAGELIPWAWGVNGYCSVVSSSLAVLVTIKQGFLFLFLLTVVVYAAAGLSMRR